MTKKEQKLFTKYKAATFKYFEDGGWNHEELFNIRAANTFEELYEGGLDFEGIGFFARETGARKGYGEEGIGSLLDEFCDDIKKITGIDIQDYLYA